MTITKAIKRVLKVFRTGAVVLLVFTCTPDESDDAIPYQEFPDIVLNLSLPQNFNLRTVGNFKYIDGGVRGIIVYKRSNDTWLAFERNCSFQPNDACATVEVDPTGFQMFDPCCSSVFTFDGNPSSGIAWRPLRQYLVRTSVNEITITDEVINGI